MKWLYNKENFIMALALCFWHSLHTSPVALATIETFHQSNDVLELTVHISLPSGHRMYREYIDISVDNSNVTLSAWKANQPSTTVFDKMFKKDKQVFTDKVTLSLQARSKKTSNINAHLHIAYLTSLARHIQHQVFPLIFQSSNNDPDTPVTEGITRQLTTHTPQTKPLTTILAIPQAQKSPFWNDYARLHTIIHQLLSSLWICIFIAIALLFEGFLLLYKGHKNPSWLRIYGASLLIIIGILTAAQSYVHVSHNQKYTPCSNLVYSKNQD